VSDVLADACALIDYYAPGAIRMSATSQAAFRSETVLVAAVTVWEIQRKVSLGRLKMPMPLGIDLDYPSFLATEGYIPAPFDWQDASLAASLPDHHRDPWDRALIAIALRRNLSVITLDPVFRRYGVRTLW
jgi:PIN domain nuclease of toxin-antitoxin system